MSTASATTKAAPRILYSRRSSRHPPRDPPAMPVPHYSHHDDPLARDLAWLLDDSQDLQVDLSPFQSIRTQTMSAPSATALYRRAQTALSERKMSFKFKRLGNHFENLVEIWLRTVITPQNRLRRNVQLYGATSGITLGELDFIFENNGLLHHLEVAVKFYAGLRQGHQWHWLGENSDDSLTGKCYHLLQRQLPRSEALSEVTGERCYWLKGRLFEPLLEKVPESLPSVSGGWCYRHQLPLAASRWPGLYAALPYERWLGGLATSKARRQARPLKDWSATDVDRGRSLMLTSVDAQGADRWRIWIMADHWPAPARP